MTVQSRPDQGPTAQSGPDRGPTVQSGPSGPDGAIGARSGPNGAIGARSGPDGAIGARSPDGAIGGPMVPWCPATHITAQRRLSLGCGLTTVPSKTRRCQLCTVGGAWGAMAQLGPLGPRRCNRAPTAQSGPDLGPVNLANRPCGTLVELSVKLCWNLSSGPLHGFCRTWRKPRGAFLNSLNSKPTKEYPAMPSIYSTAP